MISPVPAAEIVRVLTKLRDTGAKFTLLIDLCGADYPNRAKRFDVVYHLLSLTANARIRVKVMVDEDEETPLDHGSVDFEVRPGALEQLEFLFEIG